MNSRKYKQYVLGRRTKNVTILSNFMLEIIGWNF